MQDDTPTESMENIVRSDGRYPPEAYEFLHEGLSRAVKSTHGEVINEAGQAHVTGRQMCEALRTEAVERWGMLAQTVLKRWNICETLDFGHMVYLLIRHNFMRKTDEDSIEDFRDVYNFDEAFSRIDHFELSE